MGVSAMYSGLPAQATGTISDFGGKADYVSGQDNGQTHCGHATYDPTTDTDYSNIFYCAVPQSVWNQYGLQCGETITFQVGGNVQYGTLWDVGPAESLGRIADVSPGLMRALGGNGLLSGVTVTLGAASGQQASAGGTVALQRPDWAPDCAKCGVSNIQACIACFRETATHGLEVIAVNALLGVLVLLGIYMLFQEEIHSTVKTVGKVAGEAAVAAA